MTQTATKTAKQVHFIGRAEYASGLVLYRVRTEGGEHVHDVSWNGCKVTSCVTPDGPCESFYYRHTCSHSRYVRGLEEARMEREAERVEFNAKVQAEKAAWEAEAARYQAEKEQRETATYDARLALKARERAEAEQKRIEREQWNEFQFQCGAYDHYWN